MKRSLCLIALGVLAACSDRASDTPAAEPSTAAAVADPDATVVALFEPYTREYRQDDPADWDRPIYTPAVRQLIETWKQGFNDEEVADLQDFGWLCECQDWDEKTFNATVQPHPAPANGRVEVPVEVAIGWDEVRSARYALVLDDGRWLVDDVRSEAFPDGLQAALRQAIANMTPGAA